MLVDGGQRAGQCCVFSYFHDSHFPAADFTVKNASCDVYYSTHGLCEEVFSSRSCICHEALGHYSRLFY